jgi:molybdate transport system substrate-binding protein
MKVNRAISAIAGLGLAVLSAQANLAHAAEIKVWTARAIATVLADVGPQFERATGHKVTVSVGLPDQFGRRASAGESFDIMITVPPALDAFIKDGKIMAATRINVARSGLGIEVRAGAPKPDISSVEAFKRALLDAKSIGYLKVGSGINVARTLERLGIAEAVKSKETRPESDIVSEMVAKGEIELGLIVITQIVTTPGVDLVGPFPPEIQSYTAFAAGISANSKQQAAAQDLIKFLTGPVATPVIKAQGMEPGSTYSK